MPVLVARNAVTSGFLSRRPFLQINHLSRPLRALAGMVFLTDFKLNLLPNRLNLPRLPLSSPDEIANEKALQDWDQRHRENEKDSGDHRQVEQKAERRVDMTKRLLQQRQRIRA